MKIMKKRKNQYQIGLDIIAVYKKRLHLLIILTIPIIIILVGLYILMDADKYSNPDIYLSKKNTGLIVGLIGLVSLVAVTICDAIKTYKNWRVTEKQKAHLKRQEHPRFNKILFVLFILMAILRFNLSGKEGLEQIASLFDLLIILAVIWSVYIYLKNRIKK